MAILFAAAGYSLAYDAIIEASSSVCVAAMRFRQTESSEEIAFRMRTEELVELRAKLPRLSGPGNFVESSKCQRRISILEQELAAIPPAAGSGSRSHCLTWLIKKIGIGIIVKLSIFSCVWYSFIGADAVAFSQASPGLVWPLGQLIGRTLDDGLLIVHPMFALTLAMVTVPRVQREASYWNRQWLTRSTKLEKGDERNAAKRAKLEKELASLTR